MGSLRVVAAAIILCVLVGAACGLVWPPATDATVRVGLDPPALDSAFLSVDSGLALEQRHPCPRLPRGPPLPA